MLRYCSDCRSHCICLLLMQLSKFIFTKYSKQKILAAKDKTTRSSATAEKQRVSCPHGGRVGLDPQAPSPSTPSGYTYAYG